MTGYAAAYDCYYDGQRMIEMRDGSANVLKQHLWGAQYVDELCQIGVNDDPEDASEDACETFYYACQNANFNVIGLLAADGTLTERYEYAPYGERRAYIPAGSDDPLCLASTLTSRPADVSGAPQPYDRCEIGHQGLPHDKEFGLIYNRGNYLHPVLQRKMSRDRGGYVDGMSLYEYLRSGPIGSLDPDGRMTIDACQSYWAKEWLPRAQLMTIVSRAPTDIPAEIRRAAAVVRQIINEKDSVPPMTNPKWEQHREHMQRATSLR
ncbi:MAG: RHS repeat-associated core domain-containing protein, partial [Planctomycetota bacterium]